MNKTFKTEFTSSSASASFLSLYTDYFILFCMTFLKKNNSSIDFM